MLFAEDAAKAEWPLLVQIVVGTLTAVGVLYQIVKKEKRTDKTEETKQDVSVSAILRKLLSEALERSGKEYANHLVEQDTLRTEMRELRKELDEVKDEHSSCREEYASLKSRFDSMEERERARERVVKNVGNNP